MKKLALSSLLILVLYSCKPNQSVVKSNNNQLFRITSINSKKNIYVIEAIRNDSLFKIISNKQNEENNISNKIKVGGYYDLHLIKIFPDDNVSGSYISMISAYQYEGNKIKIDRKYHSSVYFIKNLNGLNLENISD